MATQGSTPAERASSRCTLGSATWVMDRSRASSRIAADSTARTSDGRSVVARGTFTGPIVCSPAGRGKHTVAADPQPRCVAAAQRGRASRWRRTAALTRSTSPVASQVQHPAAEHGQQQRALGPRPPRGRSPSSTASQSRTVWPRRSRPTARPAHRPIARRPRTRARAPPGARRRPASPRRRAPPPGDPVRRRCPDPLQRRHLVGPRPRQQRPDQPVLAAEQEHQHARAGPNGRGQRSQRQLGQAVLENVGVGPLEQLGLAGDGPGSAAGTALSCHWNSRSSRR